MAFPRPFAQFLPQIGFRIVKDGKIERAGLLLLQGTTHDVVRLGQDNCCLGIVDRQKGELEYTVNHRTNKSWTVNGDNHILTILSVADRLRPFGFETAEMLSVLETAKRSGWSGSFPAELRETLSKARLYPRISESGFFHIVWQSEPLCLAYGLHTGANQLTLFRTDKRGRENERFFYKRFEDGRRFRWHGQGSHDPGVGPFRRGSFEEVGQWLGTLLPVDDLSGHEKFDIMRDWTNMLAGGEDAIRPVYPDIADTGTDWPATEKRTGPD